MPIGAGRLYLESKENCLRLHKAIGEVAAEEGCRMVRKLRGSARMEASMIQTLKGHSGERCTRVWPMLPLHR
jgi:hypothetical protein